MDAARSCLDRIDHREMRTPFLHESGGRTRAKSRQEGSRRQGLGFRRVACLGRSASSLQQFLGGPSGIHDAAENLGAVLPKIAINDFHVPYPK